MSETRIRVFVIEPVRAQIDISKADKFGSIEYVFGPKIRRCSVFNHEKFGNAVLQRLVTLNFNHKVDCICVAGSMLTVTVALVAISQVYDEFNVLLFNAPNDVYVIKRFNRLNWNALL